MTKTISEYLTFRGGEWISQSFVDTPDITKVNDIKFYYANIIDYTRLIMCLMAAYTITTEWHLLSAFLILSGTALDYIDGIVARAYDQCSIFGCGLDWLADLLCQILMVIWWARFDMSVVPWLLIATFIEVGTGLFDFAITATSKYPILKKDRTGFFVILNWSMPYNTYTPFGDIIWYSYPLYCVLRTLECCYGYDKLMPILHFSTVITEPNLILILFLFNRYCLLIPAILYIWCEAAFGVHIIGSWMEPSRKKEMARDEIIYDDTSTAYQGGCIHYKSLSNENKNLLEKCYEDLQLTLKDQFQSALTNCETFWVNLWKRTGDITATIKFEEQEKLNELVNALIEKYYHPNSVLVDGYGYILNPINSRCQTFHIDYTSAYSSLFIPLVALSPDNAMQYIIPLSTIESDLFEEVIKDPNRVDMNLLLQTNGSYSVRQCIANPFTVIKLDFGTIHRAISNQGTYHRPMFYVSVVRKDTINQTNIPDEPLIASIKKHL